MIFRELGRYLRQVPTILELGFRNQLFLNVEQFLNLEMQMSMC